MSDGLMLKALYAKQAGKPPPVLVDCGYMTEERSRQAYDALRAAGVGHARFSIEGFNRLLVELPPRKAEALIAAHPIVEGGGYWQTTHCWKPDEKGGGS